MSLLPVPTAQLKDGLGALWGLGELRVPGGMFQGRAVPARARVLGQHRGGGFAGFQLSLAVGLSCCDLLMLLPGLGGAELLLQE